MGGRCGTVLRTASFADALDTLLAANPLSVKERANGRVLRVADCFRANDKDLEKKPNGFIWSVVVLARVDKATEPTLACALRSLSLLMGMRVEPRYCSTGSIMMGGERWNAFEYEILIPCLLLAFSIRSGNTRYFVSRNERNAMAHAHFSNICNAYANEEGYLRWLQAHCRESARVVGVSGGGLFISIVVPVFRTPPAYLKRLIESVLGQTCGR